MATNDMGKSIGETALSICETQDSMDVRLRKLVEEGMVRGLIFAGVLQCPACLMAIGLDFEVLILSCGDGLLTLPLRNVALRELF